MKSGIKNSKVIKLFVAPNGNDAWSGLLAQPNRAGTNGPFATIRAAQTARNFRLKKDFHKPVYIILRGGTYFLNAPIILGPRDSGIPRHGLLTRLANDPPAPLTFEAYPGETPVISGGHRITNWRETTVHEKTAWVTSLAEVKRGTWNFRQLWVNGCRRSRVCLPRKGHFQFVAPPTKPAKHDLPYDAGEDRFLYRPGDLSAHWRNLRDVEIVFNNFWIDQHPGLKRVDTRQGLAVLDRPTHTRLIDDSWRKGMALKSRMGFYRVENVFEALEQPGDWYLDRTEGKLYYLPLPNETIQSAQIIAPRLEQILLIEGDSLEKKPVQEVRFKDITFSHTEWALPRGQAAPGIQSACDVTGAVRLRNARAVDFDRCTFVHIGGYALECAEATRDIRIVRCDVADTGAGGIKVWHGCNRTTISDCHIHDGGRVHASGAGILIGKTCGTLVLHNAVHDFGYSGISAGWEWTDDEANAYGNVIEYNHIYDIGRGELNDLGGIYTLGISPGTRIRHNLVHNVRGRSQFAWGIYLDACSGQILVENNLVFRADDGALMMNQSREHVIRNNILALGSKYQVIRNVRTAFPTCTFEHNLVYAASGSLWAGDWKDNRADLKHNLYFAARGNRPRFAGLSFRQWQKRGLDTGSLIADPMFRDPENGDFRLARKSPALKIGFVPFDLSTIGPRH